MIKFEFTKVWKKKYILLLIILAFLLAGQSLSVIKSKGGIFHLNEKQMYDREFYLNTLTQRLSDTINLSDEDFKNLSTLAVRKRYKYDDAKEWIILWLDGWKWYL